MTWHLRFHENKGKASTCPLKPRSRCAEYCSYQSLLVKLTQASPDAKGEKIYRHLSVEGVSKNVQPFLIHHAAPQGLLKRPHIHKGHNSGVLPYFNVQILL